MDWRLLAGVSAEDVNRLVAIAERRFFRRGQVVFHENDPADALHLVVRGHFAVRVTIPTGEAVLLAVVGSGDAFGELALVSNSRRGATVQAFSDGETLALHRDAFEALRRARPQVDRSLAAILAERSRRLNELLVEAHYVDADVRVRRRLLELGEAFGGTIPLTQEEIAQTAGTSRATVNRVLREEESAGAVELGRGRTTITDSASLQGRATS